MEVPATEAGVVKEIRVKVGDKVSEGSLIVVIETERRAAPTERQPPRPQRPAPAAAKPAQPAAPATTPRPNPRRRRSKRLPAGQARRDRRGRRAHGQLPRSASADNSTQSHAASDRASRAPSRAQAARQSGGAQVRARTRSRSARASGAPGSNGRIFRSDVQAFVKSQDRGPCAARGRAAPGSTCRRGRRSTSPNSVEIETQPLSRIRRISKANLARNWVMIPHVTQFDEADVTDLEAFRQELNEAHAKDGMRITMLAFVLKALVRGAD